MQSREVLKRHADLVDRMATTLGVDLEETMMRGQMLPDDLSDMVLRCTGCDDPDGCARWQAAHRRSDRPFPGCRNAEVFTRLKAGQHV